MNVFVMMPFSNGFDDVHEAIKSSFENIGKEIAQEINCIRLDDIKGPGRITDDLIEEIFNSNICVADITGSNPNVLWEVGYAMAFKKPLILLSQDAPNNIPFDLRAFRTIFYEQGKVFSKLKDELGQSFHEIQKKYKTENDDHLPPLLSKCLKIGILDIENHGKCSDLKMIDMIRNARSIDLFFYTGDGFFRVFQNHIVEALKNNNAEIRIIIGTENSLFLDDLNKIEVNNKIRYEKRNINDEVGPIINFYNEFRTTRAPGCGSIELRHFRTELRMSLVLIKLNSNYEWGWVTLSMPPIKAIDTISFEIENNSENINLYKQCKNHFESVWEKIGKMN